MFTAHVPGRSTRTLSGTGTARPFAGLGASSSPFAATGWDCRFGPTSSAVRVRFSWFDFAYLALLVDWLPYMLEPIAIVPVALPATRLG